MHILITGTAGFIGFHLAQRLVAEGHSVTGLDSINDYYDTDLKYSRLEESGILKNKISYNSLINSRKFSNYRFIQLRLEDKENLDFLFNNYHFEIVINLAAQAGIRYSMVNPDLYIQSNINGFFSILECCRKYKPAHLVFASSSSVYGLNKKIPFSATDHTDHPISLYAATKKTNEILAHSYSHLYGLPITGLRFFTVYGPWGRPDMAYFIFTKNILEGIPIRVYNSGKMKRDFTYIDDVIETVSRIMLKIPVSINQDNDSNLPSNRSTAPYRIFNVGNHQPVMLAEFISCIEKNLGLKATRENFPVQPGDVTGTFADVDDLAENIGFKPTTSLESGIRYFTDWYRRYFNI